MSTQMELLQMDIRNIFKIVNKNSEILQNGLSDRMDKVEEGMSKLQESLVDALRPPKVVSPWKKFMLKWFGTFIILTMFIGFVWLAFTILPSSAADKILEAIIQTAG